MQNAAIFIIVATTMLGLPGPLAQATETAKASPEAKLITLGTIAGPQPHPERAQTANMLIVKDTLYLIDAGDGVARRTAQAGLDIGDVRKVFITHNHSDHTNGLANLLNVSWTYGRDLVDIYGPPGTDSLVSGALAFVGVDEAIRMAAGTRDTPMSEMIRTHVVETGEIYRDENVKVTAVENSHYSFGEGNDFHNAHRSYSYRFDIGETSLLITGDTGRSEAVDALAKGVDVVLSEALAIDEIRERREKSGSWKRMSETERESWYNHMKREHVTPGEAGEIAAKAGAKTLILTHLSASGEPNDKYERFVEAARKTFQGNVFVAEDLREFQLP